MEKVKVSIGEFDKIFKNYLDSSIREKLRKMNNKGITCNYVNGGIEIKFDETIDTVGQDVAGVIIHGGIIMTKNGTAHKKEGKKLVEGEDYYIVSGVGERL